MRLFENVHCYPIPHILTVSNYVLWPVVMLSLMAIYHGKVYKFYLPCFPSQNLFYCNIVDNHIGLMHLGLLIPIG